jgi:hypothetical protein
VVSQKFSFSFYFIIAAIKLILKFHPMTTRK